MSSEKPNGDDDIAGYLMEMAKLQGGIAVATVADGHVIIFTREHIQKMFEQMDAKNTDKLVLLIKRPEVQS